MKNKNVKHDHFSNQDVDPSLKEALKFRSERVDIINADPESSTFVFWFIVSCYFPVITACTGPIANALSVACVVEKWREKWEYIDGVKIEKQINDPRAIFAVNIVSFVISFFSNVVLTLHFAKKIDYETSQIINISGWTVSGIMLLVDVIVCGTKLTFQEGYHKHTGFWFAVITCAMYFCCTITLSIHYIGYKLRKYPARFNLVKNERAVMVFTIIFSIWLIWGAGLFSGLLHISYCNAMYFSVVSLLTVGLGDILPKTVATKILILFFSLTGVINLGLIIVMTRNIIQGSIGPIFFFHRIEESRLIIYNKIKNEEIASLSSKEAFEIMKNIRRDSRKKQIAFSLIMTVLIFIAFWLLGAVVFMFAEEWSYFNSLYFCFLCLLTIGYGDYAPVTGAGRAFFVIWAILAVPLMSAILSTVGDALYELAKTIDFQLGKNIFHQDLNSLIIKNNYKDTMNLLRFSTGEILTSTHVTDLKSAIDTQNEEEDDKNSSSTNVDLQSNSNIRFSPPDITRDSSSISIKTRTHFLSALNSPTDALPDGKILILTKKEKHDKLLALQALLSGFSHIHNNRTFDQNFKLSFEEWNTMAEQNLLDTRKYSQSTVESGVEQKIDPLFWISCDTPLRFPIDESRYALGKLFRRMAHLTDELVAAERYDLMGEEGYESSDAATDEEFLSDSSSYIATGHEVYESSSSS